MYHGEDEIEIEVAEDKDTVSFDMIVNQSQYSIVHDLFKKRKLFFYHLI
jgi:hypothetical protein